jgi:hypothetical protein
MNETLSNQVPDFSYMRNSTTSISAKRHRNGHRPSTTFKLPQPPPTALSHLTPHYAPPPLIALLPPQLPKQCLFLFAKRRLPARRPGVTVRGVNRLDGGSGGELYALAAHARESEPVRRELCEFFVRVEHEGVLRGLS